MACDSSLRIRSSHPPMSYEEDASSWAVSLFDSLESQTRVRKRILVAAGAALATVIMWTVHLMNTDLLAALVDLDSWAKLFLAVLLAPPFVLAFVVGTFIYPQPVEPKTKEAHGPMSTYFYQERSSRRWKRLMAAGLVAGLNFVLMIATSGM